MKSITKQSGSCRVGIPCRGRPVCLPGLRPPRFISGRTHRFAPTIVFFIILFLFPQYIFPQDLSVIKKIRTTPVLQQQLQKWVQAVVEEWKGNPASLSYPVDSLFQKPLAVFVTAKKEEEVRGCIGTLIPHEKNLAEEIRRNLRLAFMQDPRHRPVQKDETAGMKIYVSTLGSPKLLSKPYTINPAQDAVLIRAGSKEAVALPGEARTLRYLLAFLKAKAGIRKNEVFQLYRLESESVEVDLE